MCAKSRIESGVSARCERSGMDSSIPRSELKRASNGYRDWVLEFSSRCGREVHAEKCCWLVESCQCCQVADHGVPGGLQGVLATPVDTSTIVANGRSNRQTSKCRFRCRFRGNASFISLLKWTEALHLDQREWEATFEPLLVFDDDRSLRWRFLSLSTDRP